MFETKRSAAALSVASNVLLTGGKLVVGLSTGLVSVLSEAIHSGMDLLAAVMTLFSVRYSDRPADQDHPYGHAKMENVTGTLEGLLIFAAAIWIICEAIHKLVEPSEPEGLLLSMVVMAFSAGLNLFVSRVLFRVARKTDSVALEADGHHLSVDVYTSAGVAVGLGVQSLTGWRWVDPVTAMAVAVLILSIAWKITRKAFQPLMDVSLPAEDVAKVEAALAAGPEGLFTYHKLRTRKAGGKAIVDVHLLFVRGTGLEEAHRESHKTADRIRSELPDAQVLVHIEPRAEDAGLPQDHTWVEQVRETLREDRRVWEVPRLVVRSVGDQPRVDAILAVDPGMSLSDSDALTEAARERIQKALPGARIVRLRLLAAEGPRGEQPEIPREVLLPLANLAIRFPGIHSLHVHREGPSYDVDCHLYCPREMSFPQVHRTTTLLEHAIRDDFGGNVDVNVHAEPCREEREDCSLECGPCEPQATRTAPVVPPEDPAPRREEGARDSQPRAD